jgi:hypothetical protein
MDRSEGVRDEKLTKDGLSYLSRIALMDAKTELGTRATAGAFQTRPSHSSGFSFLGLFDLFFEMPIFMIMNKLA